MTLTKSVSVNSDGSTEFRILRSARMITVAVFRITSSAYRGYYFHAGKTLVSQEIWDRFLECEEIHRIVTTQGMLQFHTTSGVSKNDMDDLKRHYYIIEGGVDEMISHIMSMVEGCYGDNEI